MTATGSDRESRIQDLIDCFPHDPGRAGRALREAREEDPGLFARAVLHDRSHEASDRGYRCALVLLHQAGLLIPGIANPALTSRDQAIRVTRTMQALDRGFVNGMLEAASRDSAFSAAEYQLRILDLSSQQPEAINNWRAVARLHEQGEARVRSRCAHILARCHFNADRTVERFTNGEPRERADLIEGLWNADSLHAASLIRTALSDGNNRVAGNAAIALYRMGSVRSLIGLAEMIEDPRPEFRATAAWGMGQTGDPRFAALLRKATDSGDAPLRIAAIRALKLVLREENAPSPDSLRVSCVSTHIFDRYRELWVRVLDPGGEFVDGVRPTDFFLSGPAGWILYYFAQRRAAAKPAASIRLVYPVWLHEVLTHALAMLRTMPDVTPVSYGLVSVDRTVPADFSGASWSALADFRSVVRTADEACHLALGPDGSGNEQHLALLFDAGSDAGFDPHRIAVECERRAIRFHTWRISRADKESAVQLLVHFAAALGNRYVIRTKACDPVFALAVRDSRHSPPRFSTRTEVPLFHDLLEQERKEQP